jgi:putative ABC transport system ATP-binding protein
MPKSASAAALGLDDLLVRRGVGADARPILEVASLLVEPGETVGFAGPSGAGKSTLLHVIAGLVAPTRGAVRWGEVRIDRLSASAGAAWRRTHLGFVFQDFHLIDELSALDNVLLPTRFDAFHPTQAQRRRAREALARVGLQDLDSRPSRRLSRGERQRVAVARAVIGDPKLILADEPTASLDEDSADAIAEILMEAARDAGASLLVVSHDARMLARMGRVRRLVGGRLEEA